ncbi:MAG TPA: STAS-like domain-containing protein [Candidatus Kryptonia bacterium]
MNTIRVVKLFDNPVLLAPEKGEELCTKIKAGLKRFGNVKVDFAGYEFISSAFLNRAFGQLCIDLDLDTEEFHEKVQIMSLSQDDVDDLELAIDNAQFRRKLIKQGVTDIGEYFASRLPA